MRESATVKTVDQGKDNLPLDNKDDMTRERVDWAISVRDTSVFDRHGREKSRDA